MAPTTGGKRPSKGSGRKGDTYRIGGVDLPWDPDLELDKPKPTPLFPSYKPDTPQPLTDSEKAQVASFRSLRQSIREGPLYTVLGDNARVGKPNTTPAAAFNPFEGMPKYSQRYTKKKRAIPKLDTRPYVLKFFPKELWSTLDPNHTETNGVIESSTKGKSLQIPGYQKADDLALFEGDMLDDEGAEKAPRDPDDVDPLEGEDVDDEYEDEDEGGDYNAEQYFDDGGDDGGEDYDAGDDGGGGDYY